MLQPQNAIDSNGLVLCWRDEGVAHLRFNRPDSLNAIDVPMAQAFHAACREIADDSLVRAVWVSANGRAFMAGGDLAAMQKDPPNVAERLIEGMHGGLRLLVALQAPVVASVHGAVAGGGLGLMLGCDLAIAAEGTRFGMAYPLIGASGDCSSTWGLPRVVGLRKALELALLADTFDASEALRLGIVNQVVPFAELHAQTEIIVRRLASGPTRALGQLKRLIRESDQHDLNTHLDAEAQGFLGCARSQDFLEGVGAFLAKRKPVFTGN